MRVRYIATKDRTDNHEGVKVFGMTFPKGKWVTVDRLDEARQAKLAGNGTFEVEGAEEAAEPAEAEEPDTQPPQPTARSRGAAQSRGAAKSRSAAKQRAAAERGAAAKIRDEAKARVREQLMALGIHAHHFLGLDGLRALLPPGHASA